LISLHDRKRKDLSNESGKVEYGVVRRWENEEGRKDHGRFFSDQILKSKSRGQALNEMEKNIDFTFYINLQTLARQGYLCT